MRSFYSERTAEYALVPNFAKILGKLGNAAPIYFWKTREGNKTSASLHDNDDVYLVPFFARRPKISPLHTQIIQGKINHFLYQFAEMAADFEIPVFCGIPLTTNIFELGKSDSMWFQVDPRYQGEEPRFNIESGIFTPLNFTKNQIAPLSNAEIVSKIKGQSSIVPWSKAVHIMEELYRKPEDGRYGGDVWWTRNWYYKPVYFVIKEL